MKIDNFVCYIRNNSIKIWGWTFGGNTQKVNELSLNDFVVEMTIMTVVFLVFTWWLAPFRHYIYKPWNSYSRKVIFRCEKEEETE